MLSRTRRGRAFGGAAALALLVAAGCGGTPPRAPKEGGPRVLLIGIDGADPQIVERLIGEGRLPSFARLKREGAFGRLRSMEPLLSPLVWTTIVTGRRPQDHGILDFVEVGPGGPAPITSARRRVPALWNIATEFRKRPGFVGWYGSFPAERTAGFQVSDRMAFHQVKSARATAGATFPDALAGELRQRIGEPRPDLQATRGRFLRDPSVALTPDGAKRLEELAKIHATSEFYRRALPLLARESPSDLLGVYFELIDACGHLFMEDAPPRRREVAADDYAAFSETVDRCYAYQDEVLGELLRLEGPDTTTFVVSDHGFKSGELRPRTSGRADVGVAPLWHRLHGVVFVHGRGARAGAEIHGATILDVAPSVLRLLGIPLSRELAGGAIDAFLPGALGSPRSLERYAPPPAPVHQAPAEADPETVEKLRALGYVGGPADASLTGDAGSRTAASHLNEGMARAADGDVEGALPAFENALALNPKSVHAMAFAARLYMQRGDLAKAQALLDRALALEPRSAIVRLQRAALALQAGRLGEAGGEIQAAEAIDDRLPSLYLLKGRWLGSFGRDAAAADALRTAASLTDADGLLLEILPLHVETAARLGRIEEAETVLRRAEAIAGRELAASRGDLAMGRRAFAAAAAAYESARRPQQGDAVLERKLGEALAGAGRPREAEAAFRRSLTAARSDLEREGAYGDLSLLFQKEGRESAVLGVLGEGTQRLPRSAALWAMLGAARGRSGDLDAAMRAYERSVALGPTPLACKTLAALVLERSKDRSRAIALWRQSLQLDPNQPDVESYLRQISRQ